MQVWKEYRLNGEYISVSNRQKLLEDLVSQFEGACTLIQCHGDALPENSSFTIDGIRNDAKALEVTIDKDWKAPTGVSLHGTSSKGS